MRFGAFLAPFHDPRENPTLALERDLDPALLGGLMVTVGDEVIDGTLSSRLAAAATRLPD